MFTQKEKTTVPIPSAPTDGEQPLSNTSIITTNDDKINHSEEFLEKIFWTPNEGLIASTIRHIYIP